MIMLMQPQNTPPAPPPMPTGGPNNPYDFLNDPVKQKRSFVPSGGSKKQRLIIVGAGVLLLIILGLIFLSILGSSNKGPKDDLLSLAQQQTEIIRIATLGQQKANQPETKSLAVTAEYTVMSQQAEIQSLAKKAGVKVGQKELNAGKDTKTDATLTTAEQNNQFDATFTALLKTQLLAYRRRLEKVRTEVSSKKTIQVLNAYDAQIALLVPDGSVPASQQLVCPRVCQLLGHNCDESGLGFLPMVVAH